MKWLEAIAQVADKSNLTNRDAAGLIQFARLVYNKYVKKQNVALTPYDWYRFAVAALGWFKRGDKFKIDVKQQLLPYPKEAADPLKLSLATMARELDEAGVPFEMVTDPRGNDASFRKLAKDAWAAMQALDKARPTEATDATIQPVDERIPIKPPKGKPTDKNTAIELEVPATIEPKKKTPEPEPEPTPEPTKKSGSGIGLLLLVVALGSKKRSRGRR
ncbi:MAG: hypothetical protein AB7O21_19550 [Gammaproteobacteria bacterium]